MDITEPEKTEKEGYTSLFLAFFSVVASGSNLSTFILRAKITHIPNIMTYWFVFFK